LEKIPAVILNEGQEALRTDRSEESLKVKRAEAVRSMEHTSHQTASARYFQRFFTPFPPAFAHREFRSE
jgi:hypothetical protein